MPENDYLIKCFFEGLILLIAMMPIDMFSEEVWAELA